MNDLYAALGIARDASQEEIKAAYRRAARAAHPDREGGSTAQMQSVNQAFEVLSDPERRKHYDETGNTTPQATLEERAAQGLRMMLTEALEQSDVGVVEFVIASAERTIISLTSIKVNAEAKIARLEKRRSKIRFKGKGVDVVALLIDAQIVQARTSISEAAAALEMVKTVRRLIDEYEEDFERPAARPMTLEDLFVVGFAGTRRPTFGRGGL